MGGVQRLSPFQPAIARRRGERELRHRHGIPRGGAGRLRKKRSFPAGRHEAGAGGPLLRRDGADEAAGLCRQRGGKALSQRRDQGAAGDRVADSLRPDASRPGRAARSVHGQVSQLHHQLQPGRGPGAAVPRSERRHRRPAGETLGHLRRVAVFAPAALGPSTTGRAMSEHVYKSIELTGSSRKGVEDAIQVAVKKASETVRNLRWFQVTDTRGYLEKGKVAYWQVTVKIGFTLED